jgi:hypothetical protein
MNNELKYYFVAETYQLQIFVCVKFVRGISEISQHHNVCNYIWYFLMYQSTQVLLHVSTLSGRYQAIITLICHPLLGCLPIWIQISDL